jgi:hypothetical protein
VSAELGRPPRSLRERLLCRAEEWVYDLNARDHWLFRLYDLGNEAWARLVFGRVRRRAARFETLLEGKGGVRVPMRLLGPGDDEAFAELLSRFDFRHLPPHPLDREAARRALRRASYLPFGFFDAEGRLLGYVLVRLFFPFRAATGVWSLATNHARGISQAAVKATAENVTAPAGLADYVTVPLDNVYSLRGAQWAGWRIVRTNRRFHVLLHAHSLGGSEASTGPGASRTSTSRSAAIGSGTSSPDRR